jgi:hypothetical protein
LSDDVILLGHGPPGVDARPETPNGRDTISEDHIDLLAYNLKPVVLPHCGSGCSWAEQRPAGIGISRPSLQNAPSSGSKKIDGHDE